MFVDEDQWARAFKAAEEVVGVLYARGALDIPSGAVNGGLRAIAVEVAAAAVRAAAQDDEGDISDVPGVHIDEV